MAKIAVAPLVGAWIEMYIDIAISFNLSSLPSWERGLKYSENELYSMKNSVAPLVGAWIEIAKERDEIIKEIRRSPRGSVD